MTTFKSLSVGAAPRLQLSPTLHTVLAEPSHVLVWPAVAKTQLELLRLSSEDSAEMATPGDLASESFTSRNSNVFLSLATDAMTFSFHWVSATVERSFRREPGASATPCIRASVVIALLAPASNTSVLARFVAIKISNSVEPYTVPVSEPANTTPPPPEKAPKGAALDQSP